MVLFSCSNHIGDTYGLSREIVDILITFRSIWDSLSENGRILFHRSDAPISYAFDYEDDPMGRPYLESAHAYYRLICESRAGREFDATEPEWIAGDMEQIIHTAWDCLGASEKGKALSSPEIAGLIDDYKAARLWKCRD